MAVSGESGRSTFLTAKGFDIHPGFNDLLGGVKPFQSLRSGHVIDTCCLPDPHRQGGHFRPPRKDHCPYLSTPGHAADAGESVKPYVNFICPLEPSLTPLINSDSAAFGRLLQHHRRLGKACSARSIPEYISSSHPRFELVHYSAYTSIQLIFQLTVRSLTGAEIADDPAIVLRLQHLYDQVDEGNTPAAILLPWWPSLGMIKKLLATKRIYDIITRAIDARLKSGKPRDDTLQILLDSGDDNLVVVGFMMGLIIAGARSTGTTGMQLVFELFHHLTSIQQAGC